MGYTIAQKIIKAHLVSGEMTPGAEIGLRIDQTLTQDATGTMAYLALEAMDVPRVRTELSVAYIDHNTLQCGFENADDHRFIQTVARKYGVRFSRPGNGICHQVHLERFGKPGKTLIGSDSHTPTGGALGMLAMGAGGMDVAVAMAGGAYYINMPRMFKVNLTGKLPPWVSAKDISLEILRILSVRGGARGDHRMGRRGHPNARSARLYHHHQYGHRAGRDHVHLPRRRGDAGVSARAGQGRGLHAPCQRPGRRLRPRHRHRLIHARTALRLPALAGQRPGGARA